MSRLVKESVSKTIIRMAVPMLGATFSLSAYNLTDTWFVSRLGTAPLAAMSFVFPVVMFLRFVVKGLSTGAMTCVGHALGRKAEGDAARLTTHSVLLSFAMVCLITPAGLLSMKPLFLHLGASGEVLSLTGEYMSIWYGGLPITVTQMLLIDIIISLGSAKTASLLIIAGTLLNFILDPLFIFGFFFFPRMEIRGAAAATILSQAIIMLAAFYLMRRKYGLITFGAFSPAHILRSWRRILVIGIPSILSSILTPISLAVIIKIVAGFCSAAVAACGVAGRIEMFAFMIPMTVGMSILPFAAQNYGAKRLDRIETARRGTMLFAFFFGLFMAAVFLLIARPLGMFFSRDKEVIDILCAYIYITCFGYGFLEIHRYCGFYMTGLHRPVSAAILNVIRIIVLLIPLSYLGSKVIGLNGVFWGRLLSDLLAGTIGIIWLKRMLRSMRTV